MKPYPLFFCALMALCSPVSLLAVDDAPALNAADVLAALKDLRDQRTKMTATSRQKALSETKAALSDPDRMVALWKNSIENVSSEAQGKKRGISWSDAERDALSSKECKAALRLYFNWLSITLQKSIGTPSKDLLPAVNEHLNGVQTVRSVIDEIEADIQKAREQNASGRHGLAKKTGDDEAIRRVYADITGRDLKSSPVARAWRLDAVLDGLENWPMNPGDFDGIALGVVQPILRELKDVRVLEYWDKKLREEGEDAKKTKLVAELDRFNTLRRPDLLWSRAKEIRNIGFPNRAALDMLNIIKTYPAHPNADQWIADLEGVLRPPAPAAAATTSASPGSTN